MGKKQRGRNLARSAVQGRRFLIVVEGDVTEREYLDAVRRSRRIQGVNVRIEHRCTDPIGIVNDAKRLRNEARKLEPFDEVWCVFDVEAKLAQQARPGLADAIHAAEQAGIKCAISNPCFEVWLCWHSALQTAPIDSDAIQRRCLELRIAESGRGKHLRDTNKLIAIGYEAAKIRAMDMEITHDRNGKTKPEDRNPSSGMYLLIDAIYAAFPARE